MALSHWERLALAETINKIREISEGIEQPLHPQGTWYETMTKIVTYNVNGLRARIPPYKSLHGFLSALDADIICLQEIKLSKQDLTADIAISEGYEAFFSCTRTSNKGKIGYSGVATFCRAPATIPIAADEGFTGLLHSSKGIQVIEGASRVGFYDDVLNSMPQDELLCLDNEGRCIITDHGSFVLFNIYGPRVEQGDIARMEFKLNFYKGLQIRWESLLKAGKRLLIVGDLNICPFAIDSCNPGPEFNSNPSRKWLQSLLSTQGGPLTDVFRAIHGERKDAYTCWPQHTGGEEFNWGTRIDLILAAGLCSHLREDMSDLAVLENSHVFASCEIEDCDIMVKFKRCKEDSLPRWAGGRTLKLEGSDHVPVYVTLASQPTIGPHCIPSLAVRFLPQLRGRQQSIDTLLEKRTNINVGYDVHGSSAYIRNGNSTDVEMGVNDVEGERSTKNNNIFKRDTGIKPTSSVAKLQKFDLKIKKIKRYSQMRLQKFLTNSSCTSNVTPKTGLVVINKAIKGDIHPQSSIQDTIMVEHSDMENTTTWSNGNDGCKNSAHEVDVRSMREIEKFVCTNEVNYNNNFVKRSLDESEGTLSNHVKKESVQSEWKRIQTTMARRIPVCRGHGEACVFRVVIKKGPNLGRGFYVCARAQGPPSNPEARCDHFEWASQKSKK